MLNEKQSEELEELVNGIRSGRLDSVCIHDFVRSALTDKVKGIHRFLNDMTYADGFVGFTDAEWQGFKKIVPLLLNHHSLSLPASREENE